MENTYYIEARKWFDKVNGNTYHSVLIKENGKTIAVNNFEYGYGSQWEYTALTELHKLGIANNFDTPWKFFESLGRLPNGEFTNVYTVSYNVNAKRDLKFINEVK